MKENRTSLYSANLTLRSALHNLIECQYQFKIAAKYNKTFIGSSFHTYSYANFFMFTYSFQRVNRNIFIYTKMRSEAVQVKWNSVWYPFIVVTALLAAAAWYSYRKHLNQYEKYMNFFRHINTNSLECDIERLKLLVNILAKDSDVIFKY